MIASIARQSVLMKCNMQRAVLLGNYEYYYAAGLLTKLFGIAIPKEIRPKELMTLVQEQITKCQPKTEQEKYLLLALKGMEPKEEYDEQMEELLLMGQTEEFLWQVIIGS